MYPNQNYPGQFPSNNQQFSQAYPPQMPQPSQQSFGIEQGQLAQPQSLQTQQNPPYGQQTQFQPQQIPAYGQQTQLQPQQIPAYGQQTQFQPQQIPAYGQQTQFQPQQIPAYGQQTQFQPQQIPPNWQPAQAFSQATPIAQTPQQINIPGNTKVQEQPLVSKKTEKVTKSRPTVTPASNFNASNDAAILRKAMKGFGTDESALINVLCRRSCEQRVEIAKAFKTSYGKDLIADIRSETSGNFEKLLVSLLYPKVDYYCNELFRAMDGAGTDEDALIEVMCTMSNKEIQEIGEMYLKRFGKTLEQDLRGDTSGYMKRLMTSLSAGGRDESMKTDINAAQQDAQTLKHAGVDRYGTDESKFVRILCSRNYEQIKLICQEYQKLSGNSLLNDIEKEFSGDIEEALLAIVRYAINPVDFFARRLHKSMFGIGTNDNSLIRLCITRCEIDMEDIKEAFQQLYGKSLRSFIRGDTSGDYKNALFALCGEVI